MGGCARPLSDKKEKVIWSSDHLLTYVDFVCLPPNAMAQFERIVFVGQQTYVETDVPGA